MKQLYIFFSVVLLFNTGRGFSQDKIKLTEKQIVKTATVNCSVDTAWWKWTTHEGLMTFFGEDNNIELNPGGAFEIYFSTEPPYGSRGSEGCKILSFLPKKMLTFSWNAPPKFKEVRESDYRTWVVVNFNSVSDKVTEIVLTHLGWPEDNRWDPVYDYFNIAWETVLKWFAESCTK